MEWNFLITDVWADLPQCASRGLVSWDFCWALVLKCDQSSLRFYFCFLGWWFSTRAGSEVWRVKPFCLYFAVKLHKVTQFIIRYELVLPHRVLVSASDISDWPLVSSSGDACVSIVWIWYWITLEYIRCIILFVFYRFSSLSHPDDSYWWLTLVGDDGQVL